ncbi:MAG: hypothetical protein D6796_04710 [Caldilineae bacterium]|nr:MAG: hypothetical protein D6796_04710 [Caldilineae bacterium]
MLTGCTPPTPPAEGGGGLPTGVPLQQAQVVKVVDGDTIHVRLDGQEYTVRYILINTPETKHPTKGTEPFGPEAFEANRRLVEGKTVWLEKDVSETDRYGRLLRYVYVDGRMVNEELLRLGLAQVVTFPPDVKYVERFLAIQRQAQANGVGMWGGWGRVQITALNVYEEYADLTNTTHQPQDLTGWRLVSERGGQSCPLAGILSPGETVRVWARAADAGRGGYNCGFEHGIWSNSQPDPAILYDADGIEVHRRE